MTDSEYEVAMDKALHLAGSGAGWNARYLLALRQCGLKLIPDPRKDGKGKLPDEFMCYCWAPIPLEGDPEPYPVKALIVELDRERWGCEMLTDKELDEIEARLAYWTKSVDWVAPVNLLADAVALLAEVRRVRAPLPIYYGVRDVP